MAKRKRNQRVGARSSTTNELNKKVKAMFSADPSKETDPVTIQIVAGSYDRVLHGMTATITPGKNTEFADTFFIMPHTSAIRCLALSPASSLVPKQSQKIILASGSTDERINLYHLSAHPPRKNLKPKLPSLHSKPTVEDSQNRELGALLHHTSSVTALYFPTRSKLLSSAEDSTIAVTRTRDWSLLSTIKAPIPKPLGRPSGDTAPAGGAPSGVNDFAVHPSLKLMISVGKGEKCMRLWNLVTGKKAGVLNFGRELLSEAGEGRFGSGEGRKVDWGVADGEEEFCVGFERGVLVFGMDSKPRCKVMPEPKTKLHQICYIPIGEDASVLTMSTEDGRILFYSTRSSDLISTPAAEGEEAPLPSAKLVAQLGGKSADVPNRIKDFTFLTTREKGEFIVVGASSDGAVRLWTASVADMQPQKGGKVRQVGDLIGKYETGNRITCLAAYVMLPRPEGVSDELEDVEEAASAEVESSSSDSE